MYIIQGSCFLCTRRDTSALRSINGLKLACSCYTTYSHCQLSHLKTALWSLCLTIKSLKESLPYFRKSLLFWPTATNCETQSFRCRQMLFRVHYSAYNSQPIGTNDPPRSNPNTPHFMVTKGSLQCLQQPASAH